VSSVGPNYTTMCFVIMPFGKKSVGQRKLFEVLPWGQRFADFDAIYCNIFEPAIKETPLPEGGYLVPYRTDMNPAASVIDVEMFRGIAYARMVLSDITGQNANVFYELGVRHHSNQTGTTIFRQTDSPIPFDISHIKAIPYEYFPAENIERARATVKRVLTESLKQNLITSPVQIAIRNQSQMPDAAQNAMKAAEEAIRRLDPEAAIAEYKNALTAAPGDALLHFKLGLLHKYKGRWLEASEQFKAAILISPDYAEAHRELGIAQNKLLKHDSPPGTPTGEAALLRAIELNARDFDSHASLGGVLKRAGRLAESLREYEIAAELSESHPYPLLNALKVRAVKDGQIHLDEATNFRLARAERFRRSQASNSPPIDSPWCYFDLAEIRLYQGSMDDFLKLIDEGNLANGTRSWQSETFRKSLEPLLAAGYQPPGLVEGIERLKKAEAWLPK
jgi:tetratricopeptide (TPR) repeat protein